jgi:hypothetical protein
LHPSDFGVSDRRGVNYNMETSAANGFAGIWELQEKQEA